MRPTGTGVQSVSWVRPDSSNEQLGVEDGEEGGWSRSGRCSLAPCRNEEQQISMGMEYACVCLASPWPSRLAVCSALRSLPLRLLRNEGYADSQGVSSCLVSSGSAVMARLRVALMTSRARLYRQCAAAATNSILGANRTKDHHTDRTRACRLGWSSWFAQDVACRRAGVKRGPGAYAAMPRRRAGTRERARGERSSRPTRAASRRVCRF